MWDRRLVLRGGADGMPPVPAGMDHFMTPEMVRAAGEMMSSMDPSTVESITKLAGSMSGGSGEMDPTALKEAAERMKRITQEDLDEIKRDLQARTGSQSPARGDERPPAGAAPAGEPEDTLLADAEALKKEGNKLHVEGAYEAAAGKYRSAQALLAARAAEGDAAAGGIVRSCRLNEASCYMKLKQHASVVDTCTAVLATDGSNVKALYRRGSALREQAAAEADAARRAELLRSAHADAAAAWDRDNADRSRLLHSPVHPTAQASDQPWPCVTARLS